MLVIKLFCFSCFGLLIFINANAKASNFTTSGSEIQSSYVDANLNYRIFSLIAGMEAAGRISLEDIMIARRIDGILKNRPADGKLEIDELVAYENDPFLMEQEKTRLSMIWSTLAFPTVRKIGFPNRPTALQVSITASIPLEAKEEDIIPIPALKVYGLADGWYAHLIERLQTSIDSDTDPKTFTLAEIDLAVKAYSKHFTRAELDGLMYIAKQIRGWNAYWNEHRQGSLTIPKEGREGFVFQSIEGLPFLLISQTQHVKNLQNQLTHVSRRWFVQTQCLMPTNITNLETGKEKFCGIGGKLDPLTFGPGTYRLEFGKGNLITAQQLDAFEIEIPDLSSWNEDVALDFENYRISVE